MPNEDSPNGRTPKLNLPEEMHFERRHVQCSDCKREFKHLVLEEIDGLTQLRCGDTLIASIQMACMHCGRVFTWNVNAKKLEQMAIKYGEFVVAIKRYLAE